MNNDSTTSTDVGAAAPTFEPGVFPPQLGELPAIRITGSYDPATLFETLEQIARDPQSVHAREFPLHITDLRSDDSALAAAELLRAANNLIVNPNTPRVELVLMNQGNGAWILLMLHHVVSDGWSLPILAAELRRLYENRGSGALK